MSFTVAMMLAFGLAFELPLLLVMLNLTGILTHERFRKSRRLLIFGVFLIAGLANPSPGPAHDADPRRDLCVAGRGGRAHRVVQRPAPGPATPGSLCRPSRRCVATVRRTSCPRSPPRSAASSATCAGSPRARRTTCGKDWLEFADLEIEDLSPKRFVQKHLAGDLTRALTLA